MIDGFDLVGSCERQATFLWQVTQERFADEEFLMGGVEAYHKFLKLRSTEQGRNQVIVPTYQIDLMWHTHILSSQKGYDEDCKRITGRTLHHDDSLNDRSEGSTLNKAFAATKRIWKETYDEDYVVIGGMYRGEPPKEFYCKDWAISHLNDVQELKWPVISPHIEGTAMVQHRIMGASSTGNSEYMDFDGTKSLDHTILNLFGTKSLDRGGKDEDKLWQGQWLEPSFIFPSGEKCFIEAAERSKSRGINNNPRKDDYIFGNGGLGPGYYHIGTKDAYKILMERVDKRIRAKEGDLACVGCMASFCPVAGLANKREKMKAELNELTEVRGVLEARYRADIASGIVGLPREVTTNPAKKEIVNKYYDRSEDWIFPASFYDAGGGCGAEIDGLGLGGGCGGGGACGAGGCGGGGCGGGGCGGGGCGGD